MHDFQNKDMVYTIHIELRSPSTCSNAQHTLQINATDSVGSVGTFIYTFVGDRPPGEKGEDICQRCWSVPYENLLSCRSEVDCESEVCCCGGRWKIISKHCGHEGGLLTKHVYKKNEMTYACTHTQNH